MDFYSIEELYEIIDRLKKDNTRLQSEAREYYERGKADYDRANQYYEQLNRERENSRGLIEANSSLKAMLEERNEGIKNLSRQVGFLKDELDRATRQIKEQGESLASLEERARLLEEDLDDAEKELDEKQLEHEREIKRLKSRPLASRLIDELILPLSNIYNLTYNELIVDVRDSLSKHFNTIKDACARAGITLHYHKKGDKLVGSHLATVLDEVITDDPALDGLISDVTCIGYDFLSDGNSRPEEVLIYKYEAPVIAVPQPEKEPLAVPYVPEAEPLTPVEVPKHFEAEPVAPVEAPASPKKADESRKDSRLAPNYTLGYEGYVPVEKGGVNKKTSAPVSREMPGMTPPARVGDTPVAAVSGQSAHKTQPIAHSLDARRKEELYKIELDRKSDYREPGRSCIVLCDDLNLINCKGKNVFKLLDKKKLVFEASQNESGLFKKNNFVLTPKFTESDRERFFNISGGEPLCLAIGEKPIGEFDINSRVLALAVRYDVKMKRAILYIAKK